MPVEGRFGREECCCDLMTILCSSLKIGNCLFVEYILVLPCFSLVKNPTFSSFLSSRWMLPGSSLINFARPRTCVRKSGYLAYTTTIFRRTREVIKTSNISISCHLSLYHSTQHLRFSQVHLLPMQDNIIDFLYRIFVRRHSIVIIIMIYTHEVTFDVEDIHFICRHV